MLPVILISHVALTLLNLFMWFQLRRFLSSTPRIETDSHLASYRGMVKLQMILTLFAFALTAAPWVLWVIGYFAGESVSLLDLVTWVTIPWIINIALVIALSGPANLAKQLDATTEPLQAQVNHIVHTWQQKLLPDW